MYFAVLLLSLSLIWGLDYYIYYQVKQKLNKPIHKILFWVISVFYTLFFLGIKFGGDLMHEYHQYMWLFSWFIWAFYLIYTAKFNYFIFDLINKLFCKISKRKTRIFTYIGILLAAINICLFLYGALVTRFEVQVKTVEVKIKDLPKSFEGFTIAQIADLHLGSMNHNYDYIKRVNQLIMEQKPDMIAMAGDMVNNYDDEIDGYEESFSSLQAPYGMYAILGNHDYGDYSQWENEAAKTANLDGIKDDIRRLGFTLLLDSTVIIHKDSSSFALIGMQNWGHPPFPRYGNLQEAKKGSEGQEFKILLSHDPNHWEAEVVGKEDIDLVLAGHTHGMQMGIDCCGIKFSVSQFIFKQWNGLYKIGDQSIYVNLGIGYIGIPCRIGIRPEITILKLVNK